MKSAVTDVSKDRKEWKSDRIKVEQRLAGMGGKLMDSPHAHEMWRWMNPDITLIFYPHRTSAGNYHCRVRAGHCTDRETLRKAIFALAENTCTFQFPTEQKWHNEGVRAAIRREREVIEAKTTKRTPSQSLRIAGAAGPLGDEVECPECKGSGLLDTSGFGDLDACDECHGKGTVGPLGDEGVIGDVVAVGATPEIQAWLWQHERTGNTGFVDAWQVENGWQEANPICKLIRPLVFADGVPEVGRG